MLKVLEHILVTWPATHPDYRVYTDAIKELQTESMVELQRLAAKMPNHLLVRIQRYLFNTPNYLIYINEDSRMFMTR